MTPPTQWTKTYGGPDYQEANCVIQTSDGGYALAGYLGYQYSYFWIVKTDSQGNQQWTKSYHLAGIHSYVEVIIQTNDGGYMLGGRTDALPSSSHQFYGIIMKIDSQGNEVWKKSYYCFQLYCMIHTSDNGYLLAGTRTPSYGPDVTVNVIKTDQNGDQQWSTTLSGGTSEGYCCYSVLQTNDGGYAFAGTNGVHRTDSTGNIQWHQDYGETCYAIILTSDSGFAIASKSQLIKTKSNGVIQWSKIHNSVGILNSVVQIRCGYVIGGANGLIRTNSRGNQLWNKPFSQICTCAIQTKDRGYAAAGMESNSTSDRDAWLTKVRPETFLETIIQRILKLIGL
jgi:hypothetical protein